MTIKFCEDCVHYRLPWIDRMLFGNRLATCHAPAILNGERFVSRKASRGSGRYCRSARSPEFDLINKCGSEGKLFQAKGAPVKTPEPPMPPKAAMQVVPFPVPQRKEDLN